MKPDRDPEGREPDHLIGTNVIQGQHVLEIGCGNGRMTWRYASEAASVVAVEAGPTTVAEALTDRPAALASRILFAAADALTLPFAEKEFDTVVFAWSL